MTVINSVYGLSTPNGWSPLYGQTVSPYAPDDTPSGEPGYFDPSGSSTGSAVAISAGFAAAAMGMETIGSIVCAHTTCDTVKSTDQAGLSS
jgi:amidase